MKSLACLNFFFSAAVLLCLFVKLLVYDTLVLGLFDKFLCAGYVPVACVLNCMSSCNDCVMCLCASSGCGGTFKRLMLLFNLRYFLFSP